MSYLSKLSMSSKYLKNEKQQLLNSIGTELSWGWSPAVDFTKIVSNKKFRELDNRNEIKENCLPSNEGSESTPTDNVSDIYNIDNMIAALKNKALKPNPGTKDEVNILLCGASDIRHVLRTLVSLREAEKRGSVNTVQPVPLYHFYFYEPNLRIHARHLFFLQWLIDSVFSFEEMEERVLMFLELYGNSKVRDSTAAQGKNVAIRALDCIRGGRKAATGGAVYSLNEMINFDEMKSKEKDFIEEQIKFWTIDSSVCPIGEQWTSRVQQDMAERYDNRDNIIDWDFVFRLTDYTNLLKFPEYRVWRNTGVAFDISHINPRRGFSYEYNHPNKTLCFFDKKGNGFFNGDIKNGPFYSFGAQTENTYIRFRTADGTCRYGNGVVSMHNVRAWLYTLMTGLPWPWADHKFAWDDEKNYNFLPSDTPSSVEYAVKFPQVKFHFIGLDLERFAVRSREKGLKFHAAFFGTSCTSNMTKQIFGELMHPDGVVIAESAKFIVDAEEEAKLAYEEKILELARLANWERDDTISAKLNENQPEPRTGDVASVAFQTSQRRYAMPFQIALRCKSEA